MRKGLIFWFTGLSGAGKTTSAEGVRTRIESTRFNCIILDGDDVRKRLHRHLGFSRDDILENNKLISELCLDLRKDFDTILVSIISPYAITRNAARKLFEPHFHEIYFSADLECVIKRDTKGLYEKARRGEIDNLVGYSPDSTYELPERPDYVADTNKESANETIDGLARFVMDKLQDLDRE